MLSSPSRPVDCEPEQEQQAVLSRNFLIDNMTDYYNNFIKKDINYEDFVGGEDEEDEEEEDREEARREGRLVNKLRARLKRSKSLEVKASDEGKMF
jgi:hypothetical protein